MPTAEKRHGLTAAELSLFPRIVDLISDQERQRLEIEHLRHRIVKLEQLAERVSLRFGMRWNMFDECR